MRWVFVLLAVGACESRYGTYFTIDGDSNEIHFDRVQLYFGTSTDRTEIGKPSGATTGSVYQRDADPSDRFDVPRNADGSHATEATYWLPYSEHDKKLDYVAAVALDENDKPVGIGEVVDFEVEPDVVDKYDIELQPTGLGVDVWGHAPGCIAWSRLRDGGLTTIAVLPPDDADCDGLVASADCNDLCPPDSNLCSPDRTVCGTPTTCGYACASTGGTCTINTCLPDAACSTLCAAKLTAEERIRCSIDTIADHIQINVDVSNGIPCATDFTFTPYSRPCANPVIEWVDARFLDDWKFQISSNGTGCQLQMDSASNAMFSGDHHMIVSFDPIPPATSRWSAIVGVQPGATQCSMTGYQVADATIGAPYDCP